ncbi:MAG: hypothetical protein OXI87_05840 [Albidovulum sp.]|nr:hypothetical protein [Albidovulum sp.]MDE0304391.1 hypothetical protein [Albidovulum sp.]MDE0533766.1 hypothetical protein [Albidovulum sp.]
MLCKHRMAIDTAGSPTAVQVLAASLKGRDRAPALILELLDKSPRVSTLRTDGVYQGSKPAARFWEIGFGDNLKTG